MFEKLSQLFGPAKATISREEPSPIAPVELVVQQPVRFHCMDQALPLANTASIIQQPREAMTEQSSNTVNMRGGRGDAEGCCCGLYGSPDQHQLA